MTSPSAPPQRNVTAVVFDLGGVLIDWNPRYLYRQMLGDDAAVELFLDEVGFAEWNAKQDAGRQYAEAVAELAARHPTRRELIEAYPARFADTLGGEVPGTAAVLRDVIDEGIPIYALSNWPAETFHHALARFEFLSWFTGIVISGAEGIAKPDPRLFDILADRYALEPTTTIYIDDSPANVAVAAAKSFRTIKFSDSASLRFSLAGFGVLARGGAR